MAWVVVKFLDSEEIEVVPVQWFNVEREICLYPPFSRALLERAIKQKLEPPALAIDEGWTEYSAKLISNKQYTNFITANAKASKACHVSDVSDKELPVKRVSRKKIFNSDTSDASSDEACSIITNFPKPPFRTGTAPYQKNSIEKCQNEQKDNNQTTCPVTANNEYNSQKLVTANNEYNSQKLGNGDSTTSNTENQMKMNEKTSEKENNTTEITYKEYLKEVIRCSVYNKKMLEDINKKLNHLQVDIEHIKSRVSEPMPISKVVDDIYLNLPIKDVEEIAAVQERLKQTEMYDSLVNNLARLGGGNYKECTRRFLTKLMSDDVAILFTLHGHREGKRAFGNIVLCSVVIDAVKKNYSEVTSKQIEIQIGLWLTKTKERKTRGATVANMS